MIRGIGWLGLAALLALPGCMTYTTLMHPGERTPVEEVEIGMPRKDAEAILGRPDGTDHNAVLYEINAEKAAPSPSRAWLPVTVLADAYLFLFEAPFVWAQYDEMQRVRGMLAVVYGPGDRVISLDYDQALRDYRAFLAAARPEEVLGLACSAANAGYAPAAYAEAARNLYGLWDSPIDLDRAYLWAGLAAFEGHGDARRLMTQIGAMLAPSRRAELDKAFDNWQPIPCPEPAPAAAPKPAT